jgi:hypothetical protein
VCIVATAAPLWIARYLPITDLPQHVATMATLAHWTDPAWRSSDTFELALGRTQYLLYYGAGTLLTKIVGDAERANLVLLTILAAALPLAVRSLLSALGRDERLALFACPFFWSAPVVTGFFSFVSAVPLVLFALALQARACADASNRRLVVLTALAIAVYYSSAFALLYLALGAAVLVVILIPWQGRGTLAACSRALVWLAPPLVLALVFAATSPVVTDPSLGPSWATTEFESLATAFEHLDGTLLGVWTHGGGEGVTLTLAAASALLAWPRAHTVDAADARGGRAATALVVLAMVLYLALPQKVSFAISSINMRFPLFAALVAPAMLPIAATRGRRGVLGLGVAAAAAIGSGVYATTQCLYFSREVGAFDAVLAAAAPGKRLLGLPYDRESRWVTTLSPYVQFQAYYRARKGGIAEFSWIRRLAHMPLRYRPDVPQPPLVPPYAEWHPEWFDNGAEGPYFDYVLTRGGGSAFPEATERGGPRWHVAAQGGPWALWARDEATPAAWP